MMKDFIQQPRLGQRHRAPHILGIKRADEARVETVEGAQRGDGIGHKMVVEE